MNVYEKIPKIELHLHLEGSIPLDALWELIKKYGGDPSVSNFDQLKDKFVYNDFNQFIQTWSWKNQFLKEYDDFTFISEKVADDLKKQNIKYSEIFISPSLFKKFGLKTQRIVEAIYKGINKIKDINIHLLVDLVRDYGPINELKTLYEINEVKNFGIIGIGIGGSENQFPPEPFSELYEKARQFGFRTNAHAGEASGPESIWGAIRSLKVDRIGHGTRAFEDTELLEYLSEHKIPLELCPISNLRTRVIDDFSGFPIKTFMKFGIPFSINTDDPKMFGNSLSDEYVMLETHFNFSENEMIDIIINSIYTSWLEHGKKELLADQFKEEMKNIFTSF
jgi:adenosine deaminase